MSIFVTRKQTKRIKDYEYQPFLSIIIPTYNEEKVIANRIGNLLLQDYPPDKFEIIVVDSGSKDNTIKISKELEKQHSKLKVIEEGRRNGKASAINLGKQFAKGDIVLVTDANDTFNESALTEIAPHFKNPRVGAVGGRFILKNIENDLVNSSSFYWDIESIMRRGESEFDSACSFHGEINAWRKNIVEADTNSLTEDLDMAIQIRKKGYKIVYEPKAVAYEAGPTTTKEQIIQKKRTMIGTIQSFIKFKKYFWLPSDKYSGIIYPSHKTLQIFSPFFLIGTLLTLLLLLALSELFVLTVYTLITIIIFALSLIIIRRQIAKMGLTNNDNNIKKSASFNPINIAKYVFLHEFIILLAWNDYLKKKYAVTWQKAETTRT
jgi:biofilm PGA synthesis N-glycosyltransferase PgaC